MTDSFEAGGVESEQGCGFFFNIFCYSTVCNVALWRDFHLFASLEYLDTFYLLFHVHQ